jgi:hypothetical protein
MSGQQPDSGAARAGTDGPARQAALLSALVTGHFVLQSAASTTVSEAAGRASLYLSVLSGSLVALGFAAQSPGMFAPFAATVLRAVFVLGLHGRAAGRYRRPESDVPGGDRPHSWLHRTLAPEASDYFAPWVRSSRTRRRRRWRRWRAGGACSPGWDLREHGRLGQQHRGGVGVALLCVRALDRDRVVIAVLVGWPRSDLAHRVLRLPEPPLSDLPTATPVTEARAARTTEQRLSCC